MKSLKALIDAPVFELRDLKLDGNQELYRRARLAFLEGRTSELEDYVQRFSEDNIYKDLAQARLDVRKDESQKSIERLSSIDKDLPLELQAEALNILAMLFEVQNNDLEAKKAYDKCYQISKDLHLPQKTASSYHNAIAAASRLEPEKFFIHEFFNAALVAENEGVPSIQGTALNNLSREYLRSGALLIALETAHDAIKLIRKSAFGSYQYGMTLCNRAHIYFELKSFDLAKVDLDEARLIDIPEVQYAASVLGEHLDLSLEPSTLKKPVQTWEERSEELLKGEQRVKLTSTEEIIVEALVKGPQSNEELAQLIYGEQAHSLQGISARVTQAMYRLKKKIPTKISFHSQRYHLLQEKR